MAQKKSNVSSETLLQETNELLKKLLILQLAQLKVAKHSIRQIVKCDMNYVTNILKPLKLNS
jgi:hypothetical protein